MRIIKSFYSKKMINDNIKDSYSSGLADPFIYRFDGDYYLFFTAPKGLKAFKTHDFITFTEVDNGVNSVGFVAEDEKLVAAYAPEIIYFNGNFYIITSPSGNGHYILKSSSIIGPFEFLTSNIHESIDGSFFIDDEEEIYVSRASETGIALNKLESDFSKFKLNENGYLDSITFEEAKTFRWTEGPYILKRFGKYYLTYTGTHFLSDAYRVNYAVANSLENKKSFKFMNTIIMSLDDNFYGLGHSATFLGPNLDSYFICYHDMNPNGVRTLNISRLMFSKNLMCVNDVNDSTHFNIELADFETRNIKNLSVNNDGYFYQNPFKTDYTFEVTYIQENNKIFFGYKNEKNTFYLRSAGNLIEIHSLNQENDEVIFVKKLKYNYQKEAIKTVRIQVHKNRLNLYFNNIEMLYNFELEREITGDIGFDKEFKMSYFAVSKYSFGNSDNEEIKFNHVLASNFDLSSTTSKSNYRSDFVEVDNKSTLKYNVYIKEAGEYYLDMFIKSINKDVNVNLYINGKPYNIDLELLNNEEIKNLGSYLFEKGINLIEISSNKNFHFSYFNLEKKVEFCRDFVRNLSFENVYLKHIGRPQFIKDSLYFDNDRNFTYIDSVYEDFDVTTEIFVRGNPSYEGDFAGLVVLNKNYAKKNQFEGSYSIDGFFFGLNAKNIFVIDMNFDKTKVLKKAEITQNLCRTLRIIKKENKIHFYIDDKLFYAFDIINQNLRGKIGLYNVHTSVYFKNITIQKGGKL